MKAYQTPQLIEYGGVFQMTAASMDSMSDDLFFFATGDPVEGEGSLDGCIIFPNTSDCVNPNAP